MNDSLSPKSTVSEPPIRSKDFAEELARLWELGQSPDVYSFLAQTGPLLAVEVATVLREDQRQRWHAGEPPSVESYLQAVPQLRADREALVDLIFNEFLQSEKHGQKPTVASYQSRFPEYARELQAQIELHWAMREVDDEPGQSRIQGEKTVALDAILRTPTSGYVPPRQRDHQDTLFVGGPGRKPRSLLKALPRYEILQKIGQGAMGTVYLAHDWQLDRRVALKVPRLEADRSIIDRFYREARIAATFTHPHLCPVYDVGQVNDLHYLTMPFVQGEPLSERLKREGPLPVLKATELVCKIARAVAVAHQAGVIHRDLKPANIMITEEQDPVVMDWGLARRSVSEEPRVTASGVILGTPAYLAPEQIGGESEAMGPAADIYSLGAIFYEMLTGWLPFRGTPGEILRQALTRDPDAPSRHHPDLDPRLDAICLRALAKHPEARFASMRDFAAALEACVIADKSVPTMPLSSPANATSAFVSQPIDSGRSDLSKSKNDIRRLYPSSGRRRRWILTILSISVFLLISFLGWSSTSRQSDRLQAGSHWRGYFGFLPPITGYTSDIQVEITRRTGDQFQGTYTTENGQYEWEIEGTAKDGLIRWEFTRIINEKMPAHVVGSAYVEGKYDGRNMEVQFRHPYDNSQANMLLVEVK